MSLKHVILSEMPRDKLRSALDALELDGVDRRSVSEMSSRLSRAHRATPAFLLGYLSEAEVKNVCTKLKISSIGRRTELIETLMAGNSEAITVAKGSNGPAQRQSRAEVTADTKWTRPDKVDMNGKVQTTVTAASYAPGPAVTRVELVWPGKYDEQGQRREPPRVCLPFQVIEVIKEGRSSREEMRQGTLPLFGAKPKGLTDGWRNKLIWGDNLLVVSSLLAEFAGKVDLIYIDPPFATGADFAISTTIGDDEVTIRKEQSSIEAKAYRDTWRNGLASYLSMMAPRLSLLRDLLAPTGTIWVHCDSGVGHHLRLLLDEVFGAASQCGEVIFKRRHGHSDASTLGNVHDLLFAYSKSDSFTWNPQYVPYTQDYIDTYYRYSDPNGRKWLSRSTTAPGGRGPTYEWNGVTRAWRYTRENMQKLHDEGRLFYTENGMPRYKQYLDEMPGVPLSSLWTDLKFIDSWSTEDTSYPTQKPESLLERIVKTSSNPGDLVADFFCGSGTALAVAERLSRRWIGCDLGRFAVHTSRKRLLESKFLDDATKAERGSRPFEVLNLGRYERKYWHGVTFGNEPKSDFETALAAYVKFILDLHGAQALAGIHVHGKKGSALIHVGAVDAPVTIAQIEEAVAETAQKGCKELQVLAWEWEMGMHDPLTKLAKAQHGVNVRLLAIPREVMETSAAETGAIQFFDLAFLELEIKAAGSGPKASRSVRVRLKDFAIPSTDLIPDDVRKKIKKWSDYIDYWAVDWEFRNDTFVNQWQTYRTRQDRTLALEAPVHAFERPGTYQILVKVVDIFGNDTSHLARWEAK